MILANEARKLQKNHQTDLSHLQRRIGEVS